MGRILTTSIPHASFLTLQVGKIWKTCLEKQVESRTLMSFRIQAQDDLEDKELLYMAMLVMHKKQSVIAGFFAIWSYDVGRS